MFLFRGRFLQIQLSQIDFLIHSFFLSKDKKVKLINLVKISFSPHFWIVLESIKARMGETVPNCFKNGRLNQE